LVSVEPQQKHLSLALIFNQFLKFVFAVLFGVSFGFSFFLSWCELVKHALRSSFCVSSLILLMFKENKPYESRI
jgi:hypothetical protein